MIRVWIVPDTKQLFGHDFGINNIYISPKKSKHLQSDEHYFNVNLWNMISDLCHYNVSILLV